MRFLRHFSNISRRRNQYPVPTPVSITSWFEPRARAFELPLNGTLTDNSGNDNTLTFLNRSGTTISPTYGNINTANDSLEFDGDTIGYFPNDWEGKFHSGIVDLEWAPARGKFYGAKFGDTLGVVTAGGVYELDTELSVLNEWVSAGSASFRGQGICYNPYTDMLWLSDAANGLGGGDNKYWEFDPDVGDFTGSNFGAGNDAFGIAFYDGGTQASSYFFVTENQSGSWDVVRYDEDGTNPTTVANTLQHIDLCRVVDNELWVTWQTTTGPTTDADGRHLTMRKYPISGDPPTLGTVDTSDTKFEFSEQEGTGKATNDHGGIGYYLVSDFNLHGNVWHGDIIITHLGSDLLKDADHRWNTFNFGCTVEFDSVATVQPILSNLQQRTGASAEDGWSGGAIDLYALPTSNQMRLRCRFEDSTDDTDLNLAFTFSTGTPYAVSASYNGSQMSLAVNANTTVFATTGVLQYSANAMALGARQWHAPGSGEDASNDSDAIGSGGTVVGHTMTGRIKNAKMTST